MGWTERVIDGTTVRWDKSSLPATLPRRTSPYPDPLTMSSLIDSDGARGGRHVRFGDAWSDGSSRHHTYWLSGTGECILARVPADVGARTDLVEKRHVLGVEVQVGVIGVVPDWVDLHRRLDGWEQAMELADGLLWLLGRVGPAGV